MQTQVQIQTVSASPQLNQPHIRRLKKILRGLGITEAILGLVCCIMGTMLMGNVYGQPNYAYIYSYSYSYSSSYSSNYKYRLYRLYLTNIGEGLWSGVWILVAGSLGAACGKKTVTTCLINTHMGFSIVASVFAINMFSINVSFAIIYSGLYRFPYGAGVEATLAFLSFTCFVMCIVSASYCCCAARAITGSANAGCCGACCLGCDTQAIAATAPAGYVVTNAAIPTTMQPVAPGSPMAVQGTAMYIQQPNQTMIQQPSPSHAMPQTATSNMQEKRGPPAYNH